VDFIFYDLFTRLTPKQENNRFLTIAIKDKNLESYKEKLDYLEKIINSSYQYKPKATLVFLSSQDYKYNKSLSKRLCKISKQYPKIYFGLYNKTWLENYYKKTKKNCAIYDAGTHRFFRQEVLRNAYLFDKRKLRESITYKVSQDLIKKERGNEHLALWKKNINENLILDYKKNSSVFINYSYLKLNSVINSSTLLSNKNKSLIENKILIIGNVSYRKRTIHHREGSHVNTPWQGDDVSEKNGVPILYLYPTIIRSLLEENFVKFHSSPFDIFLFFILFTVSFFLWFKSRLVAFCYGFFQIFLILFLSSLIFSYENIVINVTALLLFSYLGSFIGSFTKEKRHIITTEEKNKSIVEKVNISIYDNKIFSRIIQETDQFIQESKNILNEFLGKNILAKDLAENMKKKIATLSANTQDTCNYLRVLEIDQNTTEKFQIINPIKNAIETLKEQIINKDIKLEIDVSTLIEIKLDQVLFQAILYNILSNAIKYTFPETIIAIEGSWNRGYYSLAICDQGPGFKKLNLEDNILYYNSSKKENNYSSNNYGLGLYLSYLISKKIDVSLLLEKNHRFNSILRIEFKESQVSEKN